MENFGWIVNKSGEIEIEMVSDHAAFYLTLTKKELTEMLAEINERYPKED